MAVETVELPSLIDGRGVDWWRMAACRGSGIDFFNAVPTNVRLAKQVCETCPVIAECLESALANDEPIGVFGGLTPAERKSVRRG